MTVSEIMKKMILYSQGNTRDIHHFLKVHSYARLIGECEKIAPGDLKILEIASILHDIACPLCREKYGNTNGKKQEIEGMPLVRRFFEGTDIEEEVLERVVYLVGHHHTLTDIDGIDYQILIEADYLVNADEGHYSKENIQNMSEKVFKTSTGKLLLQSIYLTFCGIRKMQAADIESVADIWLDTNLKAHDFISPQYWLDNFEAVKGMLIQAEVYVYESENKIQGFIGLSDDYVAGIFVRSGAQSVGIGKQLLDHAKDIKMQLHLSVYQKNTRAVQFYQREAFRIQAENIDENTGEKEYMMGWTR